MSKKIVFTKVHDVSDVYFPKPSSVFLPEWYKKTNSYAIDNKKTLGFDLNTNATVKKCIPVFDVLTAGYIIPTYCDLWVKRNNEGDPIYLNSSGPKIEFHPIIQAPYHPSMNQYPYPKWINPWGIKTPKGYSSLFIPPVHSSNNFFTILEGFVDTDKYKAPVNFPFVLNDPEFEGLIPAGTPMVQVIPIKRDSWTIETSTQKNIEEVNEDTKNLSSTFYDRYKSKFWQKKEYK
jgi:hypothetical protein